MPCDLQIYAVPRVTDAPCGVFMIYAQIVGEVDKITHRPRSPIQESRQTGDWIYVGVRMDE